ncbi:MAG: thiamine diphosphokinase [Alistipes sp.]|nr:thiamine diphosphokinase [Alistipes sp.]
MRDSFDAVILANGEYPSATTPLHILHSAPYVVCCDGGADRYIELGYTPDAIIGDGDSLSDQNRIRFADIIHYNPDQDTNDQTKAVEFLQEKGVKNIAIVGATGKCEDHTIGNIALLVEYMRMGIVVCSFTDYGVFVPCRNDSSFECQAGQKVSIFNISAKNLSCEGLEYPIYDFTAWWQGTLNRCTGSEFSIHAEGEYIVFINYL